MNGKRLLALLLAVVLAVGALPVQALADGGYFCLSAIGNGQIIIVPERVYYTAGQTVGEALAASGHDFAGLENGMIEAIDGVVANFTRSDEDGEFDFQKSAAQVKFYCFSDAADSWPSGDLQTLIRAMAEYQLEEPDVRNAAKDAYERACSQFPGISDTNARSCAVALTNAVDAYKENQNGVKYTVTFSGSRGMEIEAVNPNGKVFADEDRNGKLSLPADTYTFRVRDGGKGVSGTVSVSADTAVEITMPDGDWIKLDTLKLSANYDEDDFLASTFPVEQVDSRTVCATIPDSFTGAVYAYIERDTSLAYGSIPTLDVYYTDARGREQVVEQAFGSYRTGAPNALSGGAQGNTLTYRMSTANERGHTVWQDYTILLQRTPTLRGLTVQDQSGTPQTAQQTFDGATTAYTYRVLSTVKSLTIVPEAFDEGYTVLVNGEPLTDGAANVTVSGETTVTIDVSGSGFTTRYTLTVAPGTGRRITFNTTAADITLRVVNKNGDELAFTREKNNEGFNAYLYTLVPGETYTYVASRNDKYFASKDFTLEESANSVISVGVKAEDWLTGLFLGTNRSESYKGTISLEKMADHAFAAALPDTDNSVYTWVTAAEGVDVTASYEQIHHSANYDGEQREVALSSGVKLGTVLTRVLLAKNGHGNRVTYRLSQLDKADGVTYYQEYTLDLRHDFTLSDLAVQSGGKDTPLFRENGDRGYSNLHTAYKVTVPAAATELTVLAAVHGAAKNYRYGETGPGYHVSVGGADITEAGQAVVALNGTQEPQTVELVLTNEYVADQQTVYTLRIEKAAPVYTTVTLEPADGLLTLHETVSGNRLWPVDGVYMLSDGYAYEYTLTKHGYIGKAGTLEAAKDENGNAVVLLDGQTIPSQAADGRITAALAMTLTEAPVNETLKPEIQSQWPDFRGNSDNNGVTDTPIPTNAEEATLYWANQLGSGYGAEAVGCPILVDGCLITYSSATIYRVDAVSGKVLATGEMDHNSSYSITPPVYYEGMLFVALSDGTVQAFHADTLESLWVYRDPLGGQPNSPITVHNGYLYTGFWNAENTPANYVCLSVTDEDPSQPKEEKTATWYHTQPGGFYWAGAYVCDDYLLVGTDDGHGGYTSQTSMLLLMDPLTGRILDSWMGLDADIRSTITRHEGKFYFTSKGGSFYCVTVEESEGSWRIGGKRRLALQNGTEATPMSTSTPVVYNGRAYVGVSGEGQFTANSGHNLTVIDLNAWNIAYRVPTQGYPQTSGLLTTAYEAETGSVFVYFFDNYTPGKLRVLQDKPGQTEPTLLTVENGVNTPYVLFTPKGSEAEYAICSPLTDAYGTIYFKNDSARLLAFGPGITALTVETAPDKTEYAIGEVFDPTGMKVTATYANGMTRDVTAYVTWPEEALTEGQTTLTLSFPYVMYHNAPGEGGTMTPGVTTRTPTVDLSITVTTAATGIEKAERTDGGVSVTFDGKPSENWMLVAAAYDGNGRQTAVKMVKAEEQTIPIDGHTVKVFLVETGTMRPVTDCTTIP